MNGLGVFFALMLYAGAAVLLVGLGRKIVAYWRAPAPLKIPTMPAPLGRSGVALRLGREVVLFESLFKSNKWLWIFGWAFHAALLLALIRHGRYFVEPVGFVLTWLQPFGEYAGFAMVLALLALLARRLLLARVRFISAPSDYLMLLLIIAIGVSGLFMRYVARTDIVALKAFTLGLVRFDWQPLPADPVLLVHLFLVAALMAVLPFSKLLHIPGIFFSPSRNQADDARERRHAPAAIR
ncbi:MAG: respiratory nitrate reductase subunit gamma [Alphaproteobacteria bacterium]|jgi:nitrate reductase gamma subunit|nr:respiratory nitrate reductase subunit gamma [Alphaproteobacteria bacterium]HJP21642.1 respiratory nitrate reductase subunit gamma [Alphaproteobacteria bacterium]